MKQFFLFLILAVSTFSFAQHDIRIFEKNGKYGFSPNSLWEPMEDILIEPEYDTLFSPGGALNYDYLIGFKGDQVDVFYCSVSGSLDFGRLDTLEINHLFYLNSKDSRGLIATNTKGEGYSVDSWFESIKKDVPVIYRGEDHLYHLAKKGEEITEKGYQFIESVMDIFACHSKDGIEFIDDKGKRLYNDKVSSWDIRWNGKDKIYVYKGDKRGFFMTDGSTSMPLTAINTPERFLKSDDYGNNFEFPDLKYMVNGEVGAMGLIDEFGKEVWPNEYKQVIVCYYDDELFRIFRKKKKTWEMLNEQLEVITELDFDTYLGANGEKAFIKYKKEIVGLNLEEGDTTTYDLLPDDQPYALYLSPNDKIGAFDENRKEIFPSIYNHGWNRLKDIIVVETDTGKIALDLNGNPACNYSFDDVWRFSNTDSAYCYKKGDLWGVFTLNNNGGFEPTLLNNGWMDFNIDVDAHTHLANHYVFREGKRRGVMDKNGKVVLAPTFDKIIHESISINYQEEVDYYLGMIGEKYFVFAPDFVEFKQIAADAFIQFSEENGYVFLRGDKLVCIDPKSLLSKPYQADKYPVSEIKEYSQVWKEQMEGAVNQKGELILPIKYIDIDFAMYDSDPHKYIVARDSNGVSSMYTISGEEILPAEYRTITNVCAKFSHVLQIQKKGEKTFYIGKWDANTKKITPMTEKNVIGVTCLTWKKDEYDYAAEIIYEDGSKGKLTYDLIIEPLEEK